VSQYSLPTRNTRPSHRWFAEAVALGILFSVACMASSIDDVPVPANAQDVHSSYYQESKSREVSYRVQLPYPQTAISDADLRRLENHGWSECSGFRKGWDHYVDASHGTGHNQTVFQNVSFWSNGDSLLMIVMRYYGPVTANDREVTDPGNSDQYVAVTEDHDPAIKAALKVTCAK
jgi:hypothetical protein